MVRTFFPASQVRYGVYTAAEFYEEEVGAGLTGDKQDVEFGNSAATDQIHWQLMKMGDKFGIGQPGLSFPKCSVCKQKGISSRPYFVASRFLCYALEDRDFSLSLWGSIYVLMIFCGK
ncbi:PREDICTED: uncharacterized protein LOC108660958 [Theobroma cacao]|uniref:Uncharacterized protein LOC108660958 n=1 Tax=Theobroma cacao TaxID=3641 RepID=A0AB32VWC8_THECC|nr:PREDICTED: uncharacterized protein LOC108660958 [Theobroma cacao]